MFKARHRWSTVVGTAAVVTIVTAMPAAAAPPHGNRPEHPDASIRAAHRTRRDDHVFADRR
jgi:hypothetical protein